MTDKEFRIIASLQSINSKLDSVENNTAEMRNDMSEMKGGIIEMVSTLKNIDKNISRA
jgi:archaellum component FlaC